MRSSRKIVSILIWLIGQVRVGVYRILSNNRIVGRVHLIQAVQCLGRGKISCGENSSIGYFPSPHFLSTYGYLEARNSTASISIGNGCFINNNFCAIAEHESIKIGDRCFFGYGVEILDSDFHGVRVVDRNKSRKEWARPVSIGNDVFIGSNVRILKGVCIGSGAVIANGAVVNINVPDNYIVRGNPAELVRLIVQ